MQLQIQNFFIMSEKVLEGGKAFAQIATALVTKLGMSEKVGYISFKDEQVIIHS